MTSVLQIILFSKKFEVNTVPLIYEYVTIIDRLSICSNCNVSAIVVDVDERAASPCQNGGTSTDNIKACTFQCAIGYGCVNCKKNMLYA